MSENTTDKTTVAPEVLTTIAKLSALEAQGVSRFAEVAGGVNRLFKKGVGDGIRIEVKDNIALIDLHLILKQDVNIREVSRNVQQNVTRAINEIVGMDVAEVNVHIEDIDYSNPV